MEFTRETPNTLTNFGGEFLERSWVAIRQRDLPLRTDCQVGSKARWAEKDVTP
jgi:hypothetical protein